MQPRDEQLIPQQMAAHQAVVPSANPYDPSSITVPGYQGPDRRTAVQPPVRPPLAVARPASRFANVTETVDDIPVQHLGDSEAADMMDSLTDIFFGKDGSRDRIQIVEMVRSMYVMGKLRGEDVIIATDSGLEKAHLLRGVISNARIAGRIPARIFVTKKTALVREAYDGRGPRSKSSALNVLGDTKALSTAEQRYVDLVRSAVDRNASDIQIMLRTPASGEACAIRMRINGDYVIVEDNMDYEALAQMVTAAYQSAIFTGAQSRKTGQEAFSDQAPDQPCQQLVEDAHRAELRWQGYRERYGFNVVIRIIRHKKRTMASKGPAELGYSSRQVDEIRRISALEKGILLVVGATSSGKSTTVQSILNAREDKESINIVTMEDPPEGRMSPWITQVSVQGGDFQEAVKVQMRGDPDVMFIGEMRDAKTAEQIMRAGISGHFVYSTFHASGVIEAVTQMVSKFGVHLSDIAASGGVRLIVAQTLVGSLCPHCSYRSRSQEEVERSHLVQKVFSLSDPAMGNTRWRNYAGCAHCKGGITGRTLVAETLLLNDELRKYIITSDFIGLQRAWRSQRESDFESDDTLGKTLIEHAVSLAVRGRINLGDLFKLESIEDYSVQPMTRGA